MEWLTTEIVTTGLLVIALFVWGLYKCVKSDND